MGARKRLIKYLRGQAQKPMSIEELYTEFDIKKKEREHFQKLLTELVEEGKLYKNKRGKYGPPEKFNMISGRIERNPRGFAFLLPDNPEREDVFISLENINGAMHNDKVFVRLLKSKSGEKQSGEVVQILERANKTVVGNFERQDYFGFVVPDNKRIFNDVFIPGPNVGQAKDGQKVVAKINFWPEKKRNPEGEIIEVLGDKGDPGVDIEAIIRQLELPGDFPKKVKQEISDITEEVSPEEKKRRTDLTDLPLVTIDGADAKDFDDAVSIQKVSDNVVRLGVHIADVSHYVKEDTPLDLEARERGTSIYLVDRVIPMLPEKLSNGICSLRPDVERLAISVFMDFQLEPLELQDYEFQKSVIQSNYRLTYDQVREILVEENPETRKKYSDFVSELELMNQLREKMREQRFANGSINFDFPEVKVTLDDQGNPVQLNERKHGVPEQLIEEFMITANRVVAEDIYWKDIPFIYRVHDTPDVDSMVSFNEFVHNFGYHIKGVRNRVHPRSLQEIIEDIEGKAEERIISTVLLKSMKKAVYSETNIGHFGLALDYYTHFTSPIRRYPDLMVHRILTELIEKGTISSGRREELQNILPQIADHSSLQERRAMEAERDSVDLKKIEFMQDKIGQKFTGIISGVNGFGFFVELENLVEGLVHVENLKDDYYQFIEDQYSLIGERTRNIYRLGDEVEVVVDGVNLEERQLDFVLPD
ncbi:MAG: ribonuclease R [Halanaerobiaceae bacterium]